MNAPTTLYAIGEEFAVLEQLLEEQGEGATEADAEVVAQWLEQLSGALNDKIDRCIQYARSQEAIAAAATEEAARLRARAEVHANRVKRLKEAIAFVFEAMSIKKVETPHGAVRVQGNGGHAPIKILGKRADELTDADLDALPMHAVQIKKHLDLEAVRKELLEALEARKVADPKATTAHTSYAQLLPRGKHVVIK